MDPTWKTTAKRRGQKRVFSDDVIEQYLLRDEAYLFRMAKDYMRRGTRIEQMLSGEIIAILDRLAAARYVREDSHAG